MANKPGAGRKLSAAQWRAAEHTFPRIKPVRVDQAQMRVGITLPRRHSLPAFPAWGCLRNDSFAGCVLHGRESGGRAGRGAKGVVGRKRSAGSIGSDGDGVYSFELQPSATDSSVRPEGKKADVRRCGRFLGGKFAVVGDEGSGKQWLYKDVDGQGNIGARLAATRIKPRLIDAEFTCEKETEDVIHSPRLRELLPQSKHPEPSLP